MEPLTDKRLRRILTQRLLSLQQAGLTHLRVSAPQDRVAMDGPLSAAGPLSDTGQVKPGKVHDESLPASQATGDTATGDRATGDRASMKSGADDRRQQLQILADRVAACTKCPDLVAQRTQTVFGVGNPHARVLFVGEAPGADEDRQGEPFVGRAGQLLNKIIDATGLKREEIYICNVLKCRPPENRNPLPDEAANCREYLDAQLAIIDPDFIVCWGAVAAQNLLQTTLSIGKLRGKFHEYRRAKVLCTYHPSYLLRNPPAKKSVWEDMQILMAELGLSPAGK